MLVKSERGIFWADFLGECCREILWVGMGGRLLVSNFDLQTR
jgi:hypothetical protein